jgi:hypothetical protein
MGRDSAYLRAFKDFTKSRPSVSAREDMEREFYGQNDRACGVLNASWVEQSLETAISRTLARPASKLFDTEGPFPTFSVKIQMAYALGLFGEKTNHDLLLIRTMRNGFARCGSISRKSKPSAITYRSRIQTRECYLKSSMIARSMIRNRGAISLTQKPGLSYAAIRSSITYLTMVGKRDRHRAKLLCLRRTTRTFHLSIDIDHPPFIEIA